MILFYFNISVTLLFFVLSCAQAANTKNIVSPHMIMWGMPILIFYLPGMLSNYYFVYDYGFNLVFTFGIFGALLASITFKNILKDTNNNIYVEKKILTACNSIKVDLSQSIVNAGAVIYFVYLFVSIGGLVAKYGGIIEALSVGRLDAYLSGGILKGNFIQYVMLIPQIMYFIKIGQLLHNRKYIFALVLICCLSGFYVFTANTRLPMIIPFLAMFIVLINSMSRRSIRVLMPVTLVSGILLLSVFSVAGNMLRTGNVERISEDPMGIVGAAGRQVVLDIGYFEWLHDLYESHENNVLELDYFSGWLIYGPVTFIPRVIWDEKPVTSASNRLMKEIYDVSVGDGVPVTTFSIYGDGFWQGYYIGVFVAAWMYLSIFALLVKHISRIRFADYWVAMLLMQMATFFRSEVPVPQFILYFLILFLLFNFEVKKVRNYLEKMVRIQKCKYGSI